MPKPHDDTEYISLDAMTPFEREVFDLALAALTLPLTTRQVWFRTAARDMIRANEQLGIERAH